ncbi:MAG: bifunctional adenosylcobinamide kinase/adenosylcobinamide-phosphate guanylyltransferase [Alphaproteobacteria bacterium]|nr:bifunctional adenosylcobinamide kinase/adenosylcobinamide-phosphate guanylyltransferase [Alphaproteobacteria bacterium]
MTKASTHEPSGGSLSGLTLVLGGARSGKSQYAEGLVEAAPCARRVYVATGEAGDAEMAARIAAHRKRRGVGWTTVEAPRDLAGAIARESRPGSVVLVDCLTLWLSNLLLAGDDHDAMRASLLGALAMVRGPVVCVANEVGLGIVPDNALARAFRDAAGRLNQDVAAAADCVVFLAAGLPLVLKSA